MADIVEFKSFVTKGFAVDDGAERTFSGHITAEVVDKQNEFIAQEEILKVMGKWMRCGRSISDSHSNRIVGKGIAYEPSEFEGVPTVKIKGQIYNEYLLHDYVWKDIKDGVYCGLSIGGASTGQEPMKKEDGSLAWELKGLEIYEVAVCENPANPLAIIDNVNSLAKSLNMKTKHMDGREILQCDSVSCFTKYSVGLGPRRSISNDRVTNNEPPTNPEPEKRDDPAQKPKKKRESRTLGDDEPEELEKRTINYISNYYGRDRHV